MTYYINCKTHEGVQKLLDGIHKHIHLDKRGTDVKKVLKNHPDHHLFVVNLSSGEIVTHSDANLQHEVWKQFPWMEVEEFVKIVKQLYEPSFEDPDFYMGFEIEGCVHRSYWDDLVNFINELYDNKANVHHDGSLRTRKLNFAVLEISTPPLPLTEAYEKIEELLTMLSILTEEDLFETNRTCGFHVNLSEKQSFQSTIEPHRNKFALAFMNKFNPRKWRVAFERNRNPYCTWRGAPKTINDLINPERFANHYSAISCQKLHLANAKERRIEVRVAGGPDYHKNHEKLRDFLVDIQESMSEAYSQFDKQTTSV
jgi:hypothetical protein